MPHDPNFGYACSLRDDDPVLLKMAAVLTAAKAEADFTNAATHYLNEALANPTWDDTATFCGKWGRQKFYKGVK